MGYVFQTTRSSRTCRCGATSRSEGVRAWTSCSTASRIGHLAKARPGRPLGRRAARSAGARAASPTRPCCCWTSRSRRSDAVTRSANRPSLAELLRDLLDPPTLLVTHDYEDAAVLADRIGVLAEG